MATSGAAAWTIAATCSGAGSGISRRDWPVAGSTFTARSSHDWIAEAPGTPAASSARAHGRRGSDVCAFVLAAPPAQEQHLAGPRECAKRLAFVSTNR